MTNIKMSPDEKRWRAEEDAMTLRRAEELKNDPSRLKEAKKRIDKELKVLTSVSKAMKPRTSKSKKNSTK